MTETKINCSKCGFARKLEEIVVKANAFRGNTCKFCSQKRAKSKKWDDVQLTKRDY